MTTPSSGTIGISNIQSEFGITAGGSWHDKNSLIPLGRLYEVQKLYAPVSLSDFYGKSSAGWTWGGNLTFYDQGTYFDTGDVNTYVGGTDYRLRSVRQGKDPDARWLSLIFTRPSGTSFTAFLRRIKIDGITDVSLYDDTYDTTITQSYYGLPGRNFVWDYYFRQVPFYPNQVAHGGTYYTIIQMNGFN